MINDIEKNLLPDVTKENSVEVVCADESEIYYINKINVCLYNLCNNFILLGGYLDDFKEQCKTVFNVNKGRECKNIYEWAELRFEFKKSTTIALIGVCNRFGDRKQFLKKEYANYNFSQLAEMLPIPDELLSFITPDMNVREIRQFKAMQKTDQTSGQKTESEENKGIQRFIILKNDAERIDFLKKYSNWGLWFDEARLGIKYYRVMLNNGDYIVASVPNPYYFCSRLVYPSPCFKIVKVGTDKENARFNFYFDSDKDILSYLKSTKAKFVDDFWGDKARELKRQLEEFQLQAKLDSKQKARKERKIKKAIEKEMNYISVIKGVHDEK